MNQLAEKVRAVEGDIAESRGSLTLFALLERDDLFDRWDLLISAPWAKEDDDTLRFIVAALKRHLDAQDLTQLSRIVVLRPEEDTVLAITKNYDVEHGRVELSELSRFGLPVKHGYIITSRRAA